MAGIWVRYNGSWVKSKKVFAKVNGQWKEGKLHVKSEGTWRYIANNRHITSPDSGNGTPNNPYIFHMRIGDSVDWRPRKNGMSPSNIIVGETPTGANRLPNGLYYDNSSKGLSGTVDTGELTRIGTYKCTMQYARYVTDQFWIIVED